MLTGTTARRSAAVVMVAVIAALLVVTGGSPRTASHARPSAGAGSTQTGAASHGGRHVVSVHPSSVDVVALHLDLATTPPDDLLGPVHVPAELASTVETAVVSGDAITAVERGPPTV